MRTRTQFFNFADQPGQKFTLSYGKKLGPITLAYETYGRLAPTRDNAILLFHALTGSQHAAGFNKSVHGVGTLWTEECHKGWWSPFIGPGKALDTRRFFVVCANYLGSCYGSTGPRSINPATSQPYGRHFPWITANDIVDTQMQLLHHLGISRLHAVVGGSLGGMLALNLATRYPESVAIVIPIASGMQVPMLQRLLNLEQVKAIENDAKYNFGDYDYASPPHDGLALARMIGHKTFVSLADMGRRARKTVIKRDPRNPGYEVGHPVESYMLYQGAKFVRRFDANTYIRIMDAWQHYDLLRDAGGATFQSLFKRCRGQRFLVFSIDSDVCFYPEEQRDLVYALQKSGVACQHITVHSEKGHDSFLLEPELYTPYLDYTLNPRW